MRRIGFISILACFGLIGTLIFLQSTIFAETKNKKKGIHPTMHELPLKNDDYWGAPASKLNDFTWDLLNSGIEKIIIDCPDFIPLSAKQTFPVVMVGVRNIGVPFKKDFEGKTIGVCTNLETGKTFIGSVHRTPDVTSDITPSPGLVVQDYLINLREFLSVPWEVATYKVWIVYYDLLSNGIKCRLSIDTSSYESIEEDKYLNTVKLQSPRKDIVINKAIIYTKEPVTPDSDLIIDIQTISVDSKKEYNVIIKGEIPVLPNQKVNSEDQNGVLSDVNSVIPLDILILRTLGSSERLSLGVPCYTEHQNKDGMDCVAFQVNISLNQLGFPKKAAGEKMFVYAFSGEFVTGPGIVE